VKIYFAGGAGVQERELLWLKKIKQRLLSFYDVSCEGSINYRTRAFELIKEINKGGEGGEC